MNDGDALLGDDPWEKLRSFGAPVYGLTAEAMGLRLGPMRFSRGGGELAVGLGFKVGTMVGDGPALYVETLRVQTARSAAFPGFPLDHRERMAAMFMMMNIGDRSLRQHVHSQLMSGRFNPLDPLSGRELKPIRPVKVSIPEPEATTTLRQVTGTDLLLWSSEGNHIAVVVCSFRITAEQMESINPHIGRIDNKPDTLDRYKSESALRMEEISHHHGPAEEER